MARSMVEVTIGDLFQSKAQTLVNTVNCVGVMGKGVALQFRKRFPAMFTDYTQRCNKGLVMLGVPYLYKGLTPPWIINFPTKQHWRMQSDLNAIKDGLAYLAEHIHLWGIESIAAPPLGCGLGQLDWRAVGPVLYQGFQALKIPVVLYAPPETPELQLTKEFLSGRKSIVSTSQSNEPVNVGLVAVVEALSEISKARVRFAGSVYFHKLAYFGTTLGLPTQLHFTRGSHGPYSDTLQKAEIPKLVRHDLLRQIADGDKIIHEVGFSYDEVNWKKELNQYRSKIEQLVDLFLRLKTTSQAELYATVHYSAHELAQQNNLVTELDVLKDVANWKQKRRVPFTSEEIGDAIRTLNILGWIDLVITDNLPQLDVSKLELMAR